MNSINLLWLAKSVSGVNLMAISPDQIWSTMNKVGKTDNIKEGKHIMSEWKKNDLDLFIMFAAVNEKGQIFTKCLFSKQYYWLSRFPEDCFHG